MLSRSNTISSRQGCGRSTAVLLFLALSVTVSSSSSLFPVESPESGKVKPSSEHSLSKSARGNKTGNVRAPEPQPEAVSRRVISRVVKTDKTDYYWGESANVSRLLDSLLEGYDKRLRPNYNGGPVAVGITMYVSSVSSLSEVNMDFTLDFYFRQHWVDPRLNFTEDEGELCISNEMLQRIWWPDTFFANAKSARFHDATTHNAFLRIKPSGWITQSLRLTVTSMCSMDLTFFPMDTQVCNLEIESYAYSVKHIVYQWKDGKESVGMEKSIQLPQFSVVGHRATHRIEALSTGNYSRLTLEFYFARSLGYYIIHIYIPSSLIVVLSWISFWLHRDASPARVALGITTVLTMTTLISSTNASLPKISYLKSIDIYLVTCFVMVFASLLEYACVSYLSNCKSTSSHASGSNKRHHSNKPRGGGSGPLTATVHVELGESSTGNAAEVVGVTELRSRSSSCAARVIGNGPSITRKSVHSPGTATSSTRLLSDSGQFAQFTCSSYTPPNPPPPLLAQARHCPAHSAGAAAEAAAAAAAASGCPKGSQFRTAPSTLSIRPAGNGGDIQRKNSVALACRIDKYSRAVFPFVFTIFNILYWMIYQHVSKQQSRDANFVPFSGTSSDS